MRSYLRLPLAVLTIALLAVAVPGGRAAAYLSPGGVLPTPPAQPIDSIVPSLAPIQLPGGGGVSDAALKLTKSAAEAGAWAPTSTVVMPSSAAWRRFASESSKKAVVAGFRRNRRKKYGNYYKHNYPQI